MRGPAPPYTVNGSSHAIKSRPLPTPSRRRPGESQPTLIDESRGPSASRRRRSLAKLCHDENQSEAVQRVVQQLSKARLLVTAADQATDQEYVEIIHDVLLHEWRPLRRWLRDENRGFGAWYGKIEAQAKAWLESNPADPKRRDDDKLLRGHELDRCTG